MNDYFDYFNVKVICKNCNSENVELNISNGQNTLVAEAFCNDCKSLEEWKG